MKVTGEVLLCVFDTDHVGLKKAMLGRNDCLDQPVPARSEAISAGMKST
jgi:hypothetical protein